MLQVYNKNVSPLMARLRRPGFMQAVFGLTGVLIFSAFAFLSTDYQRHVEGARQQALNSPFASMTQFANQPPALEWCWRWLAPKFYQANTVSAEDPFALMEADKPYQDFHIWGTDNSGRDILASILSGAAVSIQGGLLAIMISLAIGIPLGILSGYYQGRTRVVADYLIANVTTLPKLIILIIVIGIWGYDFSAIMVTIGILAAPKMMNILQQRIQLLKNNQFIDAAKALGVPEYQIILKHILWYNSKSLIFVQIIYEFAEVILLETTLSYLGFGLKDQLSWGGMVSDGMAYIASQQYWMLFFPAATIVTVIAAFLLFADGLGKLFNHKTTV